MGRDRVGHALRLEFRHGHDRAAVRQREDHADRRRERVEHRQHAEQHVLARLEVERLADALDVRREVAVRQHRALRVPGRAGGVENGGQILGRVQRRLGDRPGGRQQIGKRDVLQRVLGPDANLERETWDLGLDRVDRLRKRLEVDQRLHAGILEDVGDLLRVQQQVHGHDRRARFQDAEVGDRERVAVHAVEPDAVARRDAARREAGRKPVGRLAERRVRRGASLEVDGGQRAELCGARAEKVDE